MYELNLTGKRAALGYRNGTICVIDLKMNNILSTTPSDPTGLHGHSDTIIAIDCHIDDNLLISISQDGKTILSTAHNGKVNKIFIYLFSMQHRKKSYFFISQLFIICV